MPKIAGTRLMVKERGGKAQVAFRKALGMRGDQDTQFQEIKHRIRTLAMKHFEIGRKPREQEQIFKERFLADVQDAFPIFGDDECANAHLLRYVDRYLHAKAVPSSRFYQMVHGNDSADEDWIGDDDHDEAGSVEEYMPANSDELPDPLILNRSQTTSELNEVNAGASRLVTSGGVQDPLAAMPIEYTTSRKHSNKPWHTSSASRVLVSNDSYDTTPIRNFLGHAALGHLLEELMTLGIKNQSRLLLVATWPEEDVNILLRDSVRESRIDKFEAQQLVIALRSLHRRSMQAGD
ncbi:hypothetical protein DFJ58DRAFT_876711 [Suillus subalutaceus]|uniref:uncharacterized protein n=1 Tax=Suillus subalutaceus TaxID=48586 RepID=UPI001B8721EC|nr:uncharacterized protein DFJ58DRAFT_876711 [Suillus subalutaceus]KAG1858443.1 hypothetical protein DFJ58DRAFT_876711 [Suillus subalutaceus]